MIFPLMLLFKNYICQSDVSKLVEEMAVPVHSQRLLPKIVKPESYSQTRTALGFLRTLAEKFQQHSGAKNNAIERKEA